LENGLPDDLTGEGVIVGIIDSGFDYTHPAFLNEATEELRISRVWEQKNEGIPPSDFSYGSEYVGESAILSRQHDQSEASHGSHVASTAAGIGYGTNGLYRGIAPDAEIVLVAYYWPEQTKLSSTHTNILDGLKYIFDYAKSQNKPAVINMSLGTHMGPHDGSTLFDIACDSILGPGRIFVKSAGNNGQNIIHFKYEFDSNDTICHTFATKRFWSSYNLLDAWGTAGNDFCINVTLYNDTSDIVIDETGFVCASLDEPVDLYLYDEANNSCKIEFSPSYEELNGNPRINLKITNKTSYQTLLSIKSYVGTVQIWKDSYTDSSPFSRLDKEWATDGDNSSTISEPGNGKTIITSGAFVSKDSYLNLENKMQFENQILGDIASFSSLGPTGDGRIKPDICSPGSTIIAAVNSFDDGFTENGWYWSDVAAATGGKWYYASMSGTSMSAPVTTGSIALMLQANPKLTPQNIKDIFKETATRDSYTGSIATTASNIWGWGKMNLFEAIKYIYHISSASSTYKESKTSVFPNPNNGNFYLNINEISKSNFDISVFNSIGENIYSKNYNINEINGIIPLNLNFLSNGVYYLKINSKDFQQIFSFVVEK
ncbi:MAG TPA: S8/S53 family peptidase, partial [Candidatus Kapabacteria bacterium]|nr:S8/S53 family peptidase [Candidatus Kapabacteria bacterium]HPO64180.1 S8/S53 family peptidase [Candidatus Kapabacteria bacterium]